MSYDSNYEDSEYELVDSLYDRFSAAIRRYEELLDLADTAMIAAERAREDWLQEKMRLAKKKIAR